MFWLKGKYLVNHHETIITVMRVFVDRKDKQRGKASLCGVFETSI